MIPSADELRYFVEVAKTLNISRAAERLGVTQPSLSLAIQRLERSFGTPVLIRSKSGVKLTKAGIRLFSRADGLLNDWHRLREEALKDENEIRGRYRIGCHPSVALYSLPHFLPDLLEASPELEVQLVHDLSRKITEQVISFELDYGIVVNPVAHPDLVIRLLCNDEVLFWRGPGRRAEQDPFSGEGVLICDPDLLQSQAMITKVEKAGFKYRRTIFSSNLEVVCSLIASGAGFGILPARVATRIKSYQLKPVKDSPSMTDRVCLVFRADLQKQKSGRLFAQIIEKALGPTKKRAAVDDSF
jgi:DNA-binding transcriptional LysR family regulator